MRLDNRLSKSRYVKGLRCPRALYFSVHHYDLGDAPDEVAQARFDVGDRVHEIARELYPEGVLIDEDHFHFTQALGHTRSAIEAGASVMFEGAFVHDDVKIRADILRRLPGGGWELGEVKSTNGYSPEKHLPDAAVQLHVLRGSGIEVRRVNLVHLNGDYVYPGGEYVPDELFRSTDITAQAESFLEQVPADLASMMAALALPEPPEPPPGVKCDKPYACEFQTHCQGEPVEVDISGPPTFDRVVLERLESLRYPLHFVDFETMNPALPRFVGTSPYQVVGVQWSIHSLSEDGELTHQEWLVSDASCNPDGEFMRTLLDALPEEGAFVHYSAYERTQLVSIATRMPEWRQPLVEKIPGFFAKLNEKLVKEGINDGHHKPVGDGGLLDFDLGIRVVKDGCFHPVFGPDGKGWSIKPAIKVLARDLPPYAGLAVSSGDVAMLKTAEMLDPHTDPAMAARIRSELLEYCAQDTMSMVMIYQTLKKELQA